MENLPLGRIAPLVPEFAPLVTEFAMNVHPLGRTLMMINIIVIVFGEGYAFSLVDVYC